MKRWALLPLVATLLLVSAGCGPKALTPISRHIYKLRAYAYCKALEDGHATSLLPTPAMFGWGLTDEDTGPHLIVDEKDSVRPYTSDLIELLTKGNKQQALEMVDKALVTDPSDHVSLYNKAVVLHFMGRYDKSLSCLDEVTRISPHYFYAYFLRSVVFLRQGRLNESLEAYKEMIAVMPLDEPEYYSTRADIEAELAEYKEALEDYDNDAARGDPKKGSEYNRKAIVLAYMGRYDDALKAIDAEIKHSPHNNVLRANKGYVLIWAGKYEDALASFDISLRLIKEKDPKAMAHIGKGYALIMLSRYAEAKDELDKALAESKKIRDALYLKAVALKYGGSESGKSGADEIMQSLIKEDPYDLIALYSYAELGRKDEMLKLMEDLLALDSTLAIRFKSDRDFSKYQADKDLIRLLTVTAKPQ